MNKQIVFAIVVVACYKVACDCDVKVCSRDLDTIVDENYGKTKENVEVKYKNLNGSGQDNNDANENVAYKDQAENEKLFRNENMKAVKYLHSNESQSYFEGVFKESLSDIWSKLTSLLKENIEKEVKIEREAEVFKTDKNKTEIRVKAFELGNRIESKNAKTNSEKIAVVTTNKTNDNIQKDIAEAIKKIQDKEYERVMSKQIESSTINNTFVPLKVVEADSNRNNSVIEIKITNATEASNLPVLSNNVTVNNHFVKQNPKIKHKATTKTIEHAKKDDIKPTPAPKQDKMKLSNNKEAITTMHALRHETSTIKSIVQKMTVAKNTTPKEKKKAPSVITTTTAMKNVDQEATTNPTLKNKNITTDFKETKTKSTSKTTTAKTTTLKPKNIINNARTTKLVTHITESPIKATTKSTKEITSKTTIKPSQTEAIQNTIVKSTENIRENEIDVDFPLNLDYDIEDDNTTDYPIIDYVELYKDTTNEYADIGNIATTEENTIEINENKSEISEGKGKKLEEGEQFENASTIFPWLAAIFIKSADSDQFNYYCDGVILTDNVILTAARCVNVSSQIDVDNFLIILGKTSLQSSGDGETIHKVQKIKVHENFTTENFIRNDLAVLYLETLAVFSDSIQPSFLDCHSQENEEIAITTSWAVTGELKPILFEETRHHKCPLAAYDGETFCATIGGEVALCPSYGGVYAAKNPDHSWCVLGLRTADPKSRGLCVQKTVVFTDLGRYKKWIGDVLELK